MKRFATWSPPIGPGRAAIPFGKGDMSNLGSLASEFKGRGFHPTAARAMTVVMKNQAVVTDQPAGALEALYDQAVALAAQARGWFDGPGVEWRAGLPIDAQPLVAIESLAITARLMSVMSWLLDPGHAGDGPARAFVAIAEADLPASSPLAGTTGEAIAQQSRQLVEKAVALGSPPAAGGGVWR